MKPARYTGGMRLELRYQWRRFRRQHQEWVWTIELCAASVVFGWVLLTLHEMGVIV